MPNTNFASTAPRLNDDESINGPFSSVRASVLGTTTATATIAAATYLKERGLDPAGTRTVTFALTDLAAYSDNNGATLTVSSGANVIWTAYVGSTVGVYLDFGAYLVADKGADLTVAITGATAKCSISYTARAIIGHVT